MQSDQARREQAEFAVTRARWRAAEDRLYPLALIDTDAYKDVVEAVGRVLTELRHRCATTQDLLRAETDPELLVLVGTGARGSLPTDPASIVAAACAQRSVELAVNR